MASLAIPSTRRRKGPSPPSRSTPVITFLLLSSIVGLGAPVQADEGSCLPLSGSALCPAFDDFSISRSDSITARYPFLDYVSDVKSFDTLLKQYVSTDFTKQKYRDDFGCSSLNLTDTDDLYARYTVTVICNSLVQLSKSDCSSRNSNATSLCADACAQYALSEHEILSSPSLCGLPGGNALDIIRADFVTCSLPASSLQQDCITGVSNEGQNCGFDSNLLGLCSFCSESSPNSTDSCCVNSRAESRCTNVTLPITTSLEPVFPTSTSSSNDGANVSRNGGHGISGGAIAGIVIGSIVGAALFLWFVLWLLSRRQQRHSIIASHQSLNQPSPSRQGPSMAANSGRSFIAGSSQGSALPGTIPGARVTGFAALGDASVDDVSNLDFTLETGVGALAADRRSVAHSAAHSISRPEAFPSNIPPTFADDKDVPPSPSQSSHASTSRSHIFRSTSNLPGGPEILPETFPFDSHSARPRHQTEHESSPESGAGSGQSEQLAVFYDYYSQEEIVPGSVVSTLWAYQPRAPDEFELERGVMLRVVGIWDDGWATGVRLSERAEDWDSVHRENRDSGVSNGHRAGDKPQRGVTPSSGESSSSNGSPAPGSQGEIKAFPLVCVCLPQHWRKTLDGGDTSGTADAVTSAGLSSPAAQISQSSGLRGASKQAFTQRQNHSFDSSGDENSSPFGTSSDEDAHVTSVPR